MAWKCLRTTDSRVGSSTFSSSTGSESAPGAFQFTIARTSCSVPTYVGSASSDISSPILRPRSGWWRRRCLAPQLYLLDDGWLEWERLGVEQIAKEPLPPPEDAPLVSQQIADFVLDGLLSLCFPPAQAHRPFQVFVRSPRFVVPEKCL